MFSFSRGAYIAFAAGVLFLGLTQKRGLLVAAMAVILGAGVLLPNSVMDRLNVTYGAGEGSTSSQLDSSSMDRLLIWQDSLDLAKSYPLLGTGFNTYPKLHRVNNFYDTHNYYLKIQVEDGLIGSVLLMLLLGSMFRLGYHTFRNSSDPLSSSLGLGFSACMIGVIVVNFFGDRFSYQQVNSHLWILVGALSRMRLLDEQQPAQDQESANDFEPSAPSEGELLPA